MKKLIRLIVGCLAAINVFMLTAFAAIPSPEVYTSVGEKSNLCEKSVKYSIAKEQSYARRGNFFDSADVIIRDEGNGNIGASAYANLRKPVKELYVSLYLDRYNKEKDTVAIKFGQACDLSKNDQRMLEANVIQNSTVLSVFGALNLESVILRKNYDYLSQRISLVRRGDQNLADRLQTGDQERDKRVKTLLLKLLADVGTNIVDYEVDDASVLISDLVKSGAPEIVIKAMLEQYPTGIISHKNLRFIHSTAHAGKKSLDGGLESFGTINIIRLLVVIYDIVMGRKCSCIDEIDAGIHAKALAFIIKMYLSIAEDCQIAVATHDLSLLGNPDLRRDAVRMFEKDENGCTYIRKHVYVHNTINFQKQYSKNLDPKLDELMASRELFIEYRDLVSEFLKELQKLQVVKK